MARPFKNKDIAVTHKLFSLLLHKLDLGKPDRASAEIACTNLLADAIGVSSVTADQIDNIKLRHHVSDADVIQIGLKHLREYLIFSMADNDLSAKDRTELKHIAHIYRIPPADSIRVFNLTANQIYTDRLEHAKEDGEITQEKRDLLDAVRKTLGLKIETPKVGIDANAKALHDLKGYVENLETLLDGFTQVQETYRKALDSRPDLMNHTTIIIDFDNVSVAAAEAVHWKEIADSTRQLITSEQAVSSDAAHSIEQIRNAIVHDLIPQLDQIKISVPIIYEAMRLPPSGSDDLDSLRHKIQSRVHAREVVRGHQFSPTGSPKQVAWANDIILGSVIPDPFYQFLKNAEGKENPSVEDEHHIRFLRWLQTRLASWWINVAQDNDLHGLYDNWSKKEFHVGRRKSKQA